MMKRLKEIVNATLRLTGVEILRAGAQEFSRDAISRLTRDGIAIYRATVLPDLPPQDSVGIELIYELTGTQFGEGLYILTALAQTAGVDGDCCEFGVAQGATSALIAHAIRSRDIDLWLFDSFEGLPKPTEKDLLKDDIFDLGSIEAYAGTMSTPIGSVKKRLGEIDFPMTRVMIVPGFIEETVTQEHLPERVSFAYVDFDFYEPIKVALEFLHGVTHSGAIIIVDDYDFFSTGAKTAVDEFLAEFEGYDKELPVPVAGHFVLLRKR